MQSRCFLGKNKESFENVLSVLSGAVILLLVLVLITRALLIFLVLILVLVVLILILILLLVVFVVLEVVIHDTPVILSPAGNVLFASLRQV